MLRHCKGADLSRGAAGPPDQLPSSVAAPAVVLQTSVSDMPAMCNFLSNHKLFKDLACALPFMYVNALMDGDDNPLTEVCH